MKTEKCVCASVHNRGAVDQVRGIYTYKTGGVDGRHGVWRWGQQRAAGGVRQRWAVLFVPAYFFSLHGVGHQIIGD